MTIEFIINIAISILGIVSGMLINYLSDVLPWKRRLARPFCLHCESEQPLANYFLLPRRCPSCNALRSWRTWFVELVYIGLAIWTWKHPANQLNFWLGWLVLLYFGLIFVIDLEHRLILLPVSLPGAVIGLIIGIVRNGWVDTLIGGAVGFVLLWLLYLLGEPIMKGLARLRKRSLDDVALGFGDVILAGTLGLILGWPLVLWGLLLTAFIGGLISLLYLVVMVVLKRYQLFTSLPYGPFLISGAFLLLFFGQSIINALGH